MITTNGVHVGDLRKRVDFTLFESDGTTPLPLTGWELHANMQKPSGATLSVQLTIDSDGAAHYINDNAAFYDEDGIWIVHVYRERPDDSEREFLRRASLHVYETVAISAQ